MRPQGNRRAFRYVDNRFFLFTDPHRFPSKFLHPDFYGSTIKDGNRHTHEDLPLILAGRGGGAIRTGRRLIAPKQTPLCNLFLTMMDNLGVSLPHFGDSTGRLQGLA